MVERSLGRLTQYRCLVRDYERRLDVSEATIFLAMGNLLVRRISHTWFWANFRQTIILDPLLRV